MQSLSTCLNTRIPNKTVPIVVEEYGVASMVAKGVLVANSSPEDVYNTSDQL